MECTQCGGSGALQEWMPPAFSVTLDPDGTIIPYCLRDNHMMMLAGQQSFRTQAFRRVIHTACLCKFKVTVCCERVWVVKRLSVWRDLFKGDAGSWNDVDFTIQRRVLDACQPSHQLTH